MAQPKRAARSKAKGKEAEDHEGHEEVTPPEDLMREHGVLDRVLLIYEAAMHKILAREEFDPLTVTRAAEVVRDFIENYHEKSEEEAVFPRFKQKGAMRTWSIRCSLNIVPAGVSQQTFSCLRP